MTGLVTGLAIIGAIVIVSAAIVVAAGLALRLVSPRLWEDLGDE